MTSWIIRALFALFVLAPAFAAEPPIVVGAVVSQSGMLADLADGYRKGLLVWQDEVNAAGGLQLGPLPAADSRRQGRCVDRPLRNCRYAHGRSRGGESATRDGKRSWFFGGRAPPAAALRVPERRALRGVRRRRAANRRGARLPLAARPRAR